MTTAHTSQVPMVLRSVAELAQLPRKHLVELWVKHVGHPPPKSASTSLLLQAAAYKLQEQHYGGLKRQDLRLLHKAADPSKVTGNKGFVNTGGNASQTLITNDELGDKQNQALEPAQRDKLPRKAQPIALRHGTRLVREWQGRSHSIEVRADGFGWNSEVYRSLSAVALAITGARWSGNRFFRL